MVFKRPSRGCRVWRSSRWRLRSACRVDECASAAGLYRLPATTPGFLPPDALTSPQARSDLAVAERHPGSPTLSEAPCHHRRLLSASAPPSVVSLTDRPRRLSDVAILDLAVAGRPLRLFVKVHKSQASVDHLRRKAGIEFDTSVRSTSASRRSPATGSSGQSPSCPRRREFTEAAGEVPLIKRSTPAWRPARPWAAPLPRAGLPAMAPALSDDPSQPRAGAVDRALLARLRRLVRVRGIRTAATRERPATGVRGLRPHGCKRVRVTGSIPTISPIASSWPLALTVLDFTSFSTGRRPVMWPVSVHPGVLTNPSTAADGSGASRSFLEGYGARRRHDVWPSRCTSSCSWSKR